MYNVSQSLCNMASRNVILTIPQGALRGSEKTSELGEKYFSFQRIPYARPPTGALRFKSPQPAAGWTGIRDATQQGAICPSLSSATKKYVEDSDEDSLFVNVYTKQRPQHGRNLPVMVWIHGGGFAVGSGNDDWYGPDYLLSQDVVLVTLNYRLGALGFMSLQTLDCPGNFGLKDQRQALRWVKENIAYFGGDPNNVTIFGESAGGASVAALVLSPSTKGLFHRAIAQSASAITLYPKRTRDCAFLLGKRLGCDTNDDKVLLEFLKNASPKDIVENSENLLEELEGPDPNANKLPVAFLPVVEPESPDAFYTKEPLTVLQEGKYNDVPFMLGICSKEMLFVLKNPDDYPRWTEDSEFQALIPDDLKIENNTDISLNIAKKIREFYFKDGVNLDNYIDALSDATFGYGVYRTAKFQITNKNIRSPSYLYRFSYDGQRQFFKILLGLTELKGVIHGGEIPYLFKVSALPMPPMEPGTPDYSCMVDLVQLWVNFAKNGAPASDKTEVSWLPFDEQKMSYLEIGENLELKEGFLKEEMQFWDEIYSMAGL